MAGYCAKGGLDTLKVNSFLISYSTFTMFVAF